MGVSGSMTVCRSQASVASSAEGGCISVWNLLGTAGTSMPEGQAVNLAEFKPKQSLDLIKVSSVAWGVSGRPQKGARVGK